MNEYEIYTDPKSGKQIFFMKVYTLGRVGSGLRDYEWQEVFDRAFIVDMELKFGSYIVDISDGFLGNEEKARELAKRHKFSLKKLEKALQVGVPRAFEYCVSDIREGNLKLEARARELLEKYELPPQSLKELEAALPIGRQVAFNTCLGNLARGYNNLNGRAITPEEEINAVKLAEENNFSFTKLGDALRLRRQNQIQKNIQFIREGDIHLESVVYQIIDAQGDVSPLTIKALTEALEIGRPKAFAEYLHLARVGELDCEARARELAEKHNFPLQALEDALVEGRKKIKK